jgi:predicted PurR-regulated permease PerM
MSRLDFSSLTNQLLGTAQNMIGQLGMIIGQAASSAVVVFGWGFFIIMISYFILAESNGTTNYLAKFHLPGYEDDLQRLEIQLDRIWNAFLRGQIIVTSLNMVLYTIVLGGTGVQYFYILAFVAGIARIVPYIGAWLSWITFGLVAFFQGTTFYGMNSLSYALMVVILAILVDTAMDNMVTPKIMSNSLKVHPAAVMVAAIIGISWLGIIGVILAAPVLATLKLFSDYALLKLLDRDPWTEIEKTPIKTESRFRYTLKMIWRVLYGFLRNLFKSRD